ncbi:hypothetical protein BHU72_07755 [Desulfuribacillus stibiiarsenatis]|uniref:Cell division protein SepF n=1 Tax=Desulfuribacillus stibiiarsenatis TaxID=1390249 RepID=A0A1E5L3L9_9FIRM|nr:cell division protein SepF [Desulfuribacillus stibiiarsenatis]OEH84722.1 hypothetical protein BHU72_07755 [Desulfuribacillus stibiiarsenatis]
MSELLNKLFLFLGLADEDTSKKTSYDSEPYEGQEISRTRKQQVNQTKLPVKQEMRVIVAEPTNYDESIEIADKIKFSYPVVVNLHKSTIADQRRIIDFLSGTVYALGGNLQKLGPQIFLCYPENIEVEGRISQVLEEAQQQLNN